MLLLIILGVGALILFNTAFIVPQTAAALVFQLGRLSRPPINEPGLYFKWPFIETVTLIDNRVLDNDLRPQTVLASDQKNLVVDAFTRYRITDPLRFFQALNNTRLANQRLEQIVNDRVRSVLSGATTTQIINTNRAKLMDEIQEEVNREAQALGITVVDVRLSRVDLPRETSEAVFRRMKTDREREAAALRAQGAELAQSIRSQADREVQVFLGTANKEAEELRGRGEAEKTRIMAEVFRLDPEFSSFYRSMQAYEVSFQKGDTRMILSPDSPFFRYFNQAAPPRR
jgi:membrane protease subunit HflC